jgi:processive 1,2-diacylglycerol beta-glucosyltransferase
MKIFLLLFTFPFLALHAINLESFYQIDGNTLINAEGQRFPALHFDSPLHEELAYILKAPEQAAIIHQAYQKHIAPILPEKLISGFSKALTKVCYFFGSQKLSSERGFWIALREGGCFSWAEKNRQAVTAFVSEANRSAHLPKKERKKGPFTIVILTTTASGGNESVTEGIVDFLSAYKNIQTVVIDVETLAKETDPIMLASRVVTYDGLYASIFQQQEDSDILIQRDVVTKQLGKYIPSRLGSLLKEKLLEINPDLIISTRNYSVDDLALATLDIPFRMLHCDYELSVFLLDIYGKVDPNEVRFWLPSIEPAVFKPLFTKANRCDLYKDNQQELMNKLALLMGITAEEVQKQFECIGYPIRPEFKRITDSKELASLRKKWDIQPEETPILVSMGKNGVGCLEKIYDQLAKLPSHHWKFIFICGKNEELKIKLEDRLSSTPANRFTICGFASPQEMNELMNLSLVNITKSGGAITTEALVTETYLLMIGSHPWEEANGAKIEQMGLGQQIRPGLPLEAQIEEALAKAEVARAQLIEVPDWRSLLLNELRAIGLSVDIAQADQLFIE